MKKIVLGFLLLAGASQTQYIHTMQVDYEAGVLSGFNDVFSGLKNACRAAWNIFYQGNQAQQDLQARNSAERQLHNTTHSLASLNTHIDASKEYTRKLEEQRDTLGQRAVGYKTIIQTKNASLKQAKGPLSDSSSWYSLIYDVYTQDPQSQTLKKTGWKWHKTKLAVLATGALATWKIYRWLKPAQQ